MSVRHVMIWIICLNLATDWNGMRMEQMRQNWKHKVKINLRVPARWV